MSGLPGRKTTRAVKQSFRSTLADATPLTLPALAEYAPSARLGGRRERAGQIESDRCD